jgi:hypothetical protein
MKINAAYGPGRRFNLGRSMLAKPPNGRRAAEYLHASRAAAIWLNPWRRRNLHDPHRQQDHKHWLLWWNHQCYRGSMVDRR